MKALRLVALSVPLLALFIASPALAKSEAAQKSKYLIISPHTAEECIPAMDEITRTGDKELAQWDWGCMSGDHTGYAMVMATSPDEALKMVPMEVRSKAKVVKLDKFTAKQVKGMHEQMKGKTDTPMTQTEPKGVEKKPMEEKPMGDMPMK